ncbi:MAG: pilus assembly protein TadG-related protein [Rhizobiaceae bacterium]
MLLLRFIKDVGGNYALMTALMMVPLLGALALGVDYTEMSRQRQVTLHALDAAGIATARRILEGASDAEAHAYAQDFFMANLRSVDPSKVTLRVQLPSNQSGRETLRLDADLRYDPYFLPSFVMGTAETSESLRFNAQSEIRLQNTLEVALVLDNSGSMDILGTGSGRPRMDLLKEAATELVETLAKRAQTMKQVAEPVRFSVVPFAGTVNVGPQHANASWMDREGRSPIHHENFNWATMTSVDQNRRVEKVGDVFRKRGSGWGAEENQIVTRFSLFDSLKRVTGTEQVQTGTKPVEHCTGSWWNRRCTIVNEPVYETRNTYGPASSWAGCVETRPGNLAYDVTPPNNQNPATLFVPMFAPDETDQLDNWQRGAMGQWWDDHTEGTAAYRQRFMPKYFKPAPLGTAYMGLYEGPNAMCSTTPILPLTDVSTSAGLNTVKSAIADMHALGATDIPEGTAWGWRTLNSAAPFTEGRPERERGTDKVLIVLTDGFNTYYTPNSLGANDLANNRSIYSNKGYTGVNYDGGNRTRLFMNTTVNSSTHNNANFTSAMNQHLDRVCEDAKAAGIIVMTVALDLSSSVANERDAINAMTRCASDSRFRRDPNDPSKAAKLFWNANGSNLADKFREIADELSNLRIVG